MGSSWWRSRNLPRRLAILDLLVEAVVGRSFGIEGWRQSRDNDRELDDMLARALDSSIDT
jgi:hypothetical protein